MSAPPSRIPLVQGPHALEGIVDQTFVLRHRLLRGVGKVREQGESEVRVGVGQVVDLEPFQQHRGACRSRQHRRDDDERRVLGRDAVLDVELGKHARRQEQGQQLVDQPTASSESGSSKTATRARDPPRG